MLTTSLGVENYDVREGELPLDNHALHLTSDYGIKVNEPNEVQLTNRTTPIDQEEIITFQATTTKKIPLKVRPSYYQATGDNLMYGVRVDNVLRVTSDQNDSVVEDLPIVCNLTIKHPRNRQIREIDVLQCMSRLFSACFKDDGTSRIPDLMKSSLEPAED